MSKKLIAVLLLLCLLLTACGGEEAATPPPVEVAELPLAADEQQLTVSVVKDALASADFAAWQDMYRMFTEKEPGAAQVAAVTHYTNADFDGAAVDCYLIAVKADLAYWVDEAKEQGVVAEEVFLLVDAASGTVWDNISTNAVGVQHDTATELGRATYLLWLFDAEQNHGHNSYYVDDREIRTNATAADIEAINRALLAE